MDAAFWHEKWNSGEIGFHENRPNPLLTNNIDALALSDSARLFLPLCGKTLDIHWLLANGYRVSGIELHQQAVDELFAELGLAPVISECGNMLQYSADNIVMFVGDIFELTPQLLGKVDAVYDRAALVALPPQMRIRYCKHLLQLTGNVPQLLVTFEYDQSVIAGPPHSVPAPEVLAHYSDNYRINLLQSRDVPGGMKGKTPSTENVWKLLPVQ